MRERKRDRNLSSLPSKKRANCSSTENILSYIKTTDNEEGRSLIFMLFG
jgi:hypothetical protein